MKMEFARRRLFNNQEWANLRKAPPAKEFLKIIGYMDFTAFVRKTRTGEDSLRKKQDG